MPRPHEDVRLHVAPWRRLWRLLWTGALACGVALGLWADRARGGGDLEPCILPPRQERTAHPTLGDPRAPVTVVVFGGFQCPYSQRVMGVLRQLVLDHPRRVKVIWRDFPLAMHQHSRAAAMAAREVFRQRGNRAYWVFHALVMGNAHRATEDQLAAWANQVGANGAGVLTALRTAAYEAALKRDIQEGTVAGVRGTPMSFIVRHGHALTSGRQVSGAQVYQAFKAAMDSL